MAEPPKDPLALWRDMLGQWEKSVNTLANQTMASEDYSRSMNGALSLSIKMQESMRDAMTAYLAQMNVPSRTDVARLDERLGAVELKLDRLIALVERSGGAGGATRPADAARPPRPPRTKRPPPSPG